MIQSWSIRFVEHQYQTGDIYAQNPKVTNYLYSKGLFDEPD